MGETPEAASTGAPETAIEESDPNADSGEGLAGEMGVSSERTGPVRGEDHDVTYGTAPTSTDAEIEGEVPPEQSAFDDRPEPHPDSPGAHESDPSSNRGHGL